MLNFNHMHGMRIRIRIRALDRGAVVLTCFHTNLHYPLPGMMWDGTEKHAPCAIMSAQVVWWSAFEKKYEAEVGGEADIFGGEAGERRRADLRLRVTEHNILVIAKYYGRIQLPRLAQLLDLSPAEVG